MKEEIKVKEVNKESLIDKIKERINSQTRLLEASKYTGLTIDENEIIKNQVAIMEVLSFILGNK